jgi:hypothetical protein
MRGSSTDIVAALQAAPVTGIVPRQLIWISAPKLSDGSTGTFGFWNERLPATLLVTGLNGAAEARDYQAVGALMAVDKITLTADITVRTASFTLSMVHPTVQQLWGEYRLKMARVEIHRVLLDPVTKRPVDTAHRRFLGRVDRAPKTTAAPGQEGGLIINCVSTTVGLTIINPAKRSDESQKLRSGDRHSRYADVVGQWQIPWGTSS